MKRVNYVKDFEIGFASEKLTLFSGLVTCLNPAEACLVLDTAFEQEWSKRRTILRKISQDIQTAFQSSHNELIDTLMSVHEELPYQKKRACAYSLKHLCEYAPAEVQERVTRFLLSSRYVTTRRMGYGMLGAHWKDACRSMIEKNWEAYHDIECTQLAIDYFPVQYLETNSLALRDRVRGTRYLSRLYLRVAKNMPAKLSELREVDEITFAYVSVKLGKTIGNAEALDFFERNKDDKRIGLLIWCFGQMRLWHVLEEVNKRIDRLASRRIEQLAVNHASRKVEGI